LNEGFRFENGNGGLSLGLGFKGWGFGFQVGGVWENLA